jgi:hypothetical protein
MYGLVMIFYSGFGFLQGAVQMSLNEGIDITFAAFFVVCLLLFIPFYTIFPIFTGISLPDIRATDRGLYVQVFFFWWVFVPWESILEIRTQFKKSILRKESTVVLVQRLTPFHRLIGVQVGKLKPGFRIERTISKYDELINLIQNYVEEQKRN